MHRPQLCALGRGRGEVAVQLDGPVQASALAACAAAVRLCAAACGRLAVARRARPCGENSHFRGALTGACDFWWCLLRLGATRLAGPQGEGGVETGLCGTYMETDGETCCTPDDIAYMNEYMLQGGAVRGRVLRQHENSLTPV